MASETNDATSDIVSDSALDFESALVDGQFFLVYQPNIDLETNAFAGVEALIRWRHPTRGILGPDVFIAALEESDDIVRVGRWALAQACEDGARWHDKGYRFNVSVNVSAKELGFDGFVDDVANTLLQSRFEPSLLVLEFTQHTLTAERDRSISQLALLRALGVRFAVDDFEPGASALEDLEAFAIDIVKLDRKFIAGMAASSDASALVHGLIQASETRHVQVIASGIEDTEQRTRLQSERVQVGQGYLFSEPHEAKEIDHFLEDFAIFSGKPL
jgi:EAL domain-containing protein (putative c-di-GMP-specific phosphodiesterase class I)